jgi:sulfur carrier protein ThiS adenylyltransferase
MNVFEAALEKYFGAGNLKKIQNTKVGIAGLGGLGSNCALHLVRSGFRKLTLCDFDKVEAKNLNRQFYFLDQLGLPKTEALKANLLKINPGLELKLVFEKLTQDNINQVFSDCDAVVEGFDDASCKQMIAAAYARSGKFFVSASGLAGWGRADAITTRKVHGTFYLIGDLQTEASIKTPPCSPRVSVAASKQADCILAWVLGTE